MNSSLLRSRPWTIIFTGIQIIWITGYWIFALSLPEKSWANPSFIDVLWTATAIFISIIFLFVAERSLSVSQLTIAYFGSVIIGFSIGLLFQWVINPKNNTWGLGVAHNFEFDLIGPAAGSLFASTAYMTSLWRNRVRFIGLSLAIIWFVFQGTFSDANLLFCALSGLLIGKLLSRNRQPNLLEKGQDDSFRKYLSLAVTVTAIVPILTSLRTSEVLSQVPLSFSSLGHFQPLDALALLDRCSQLSDVECSMLISQQSNRGLGPILFALIPSLLILLSAWGLRRGRRFALVLAICVYLGIAYIALFSFDMANAITFIMQTQGTYLEWLQISIWLLLSIFLPLLMSLILWVNKNHFPLSVEAARARNFLAQIMVTFLALLTLVSVIVFINLKHFPSEEEFGNTLYAGLLKFFPNSVSEQLYLPLVPIDPIDLVVFRWAGVIFWLLFLYFAIKILRVPLLHSTSNDTERFRRLLIKYGGSLNYMGTWSGNSHWFNEYGDCAVAFRVVDEVAITIGDPVCPPEKRLQVVLDFSVYCEIRNLTPVIYSATASFSEVFDDLGWQHLEVAQESLVRPKDFDISLPHWKHVRHATNKAKREQVSARWTNWSSLSQQSQQQIEELLKKRSFMSTNLEFQFMLGKIEEIHDNNVGLMIAENQFGEISAITSWLPIYRKGMLIGRTLDVMVRSQNSFGGVMEMLIGALLTMAKTEKLEIVSLSGVPLIREETSTHPQASKSQFLRFSLRRIERILDKSYGIKRLQFFKNKFNPEYHSLIMGFRDQLSLPKIVLAIGKIYLGSTSTVDTFTLLRKK